MTQLGLAFPRGCCRIGVMENNKTNKTTRKPFYADAKAEFGPRKKLLTTPNGHVLKCEANGNKEKHISGSWMRDEIAIMEGRKSFTPDVTMAKGGANLGPIANSVVRDTV